MLGSWKRRIGSRIIRSVVFNGISKARTSVVVLGLSRSGVIDVGCVRVVSKHEGFEGWFFWLNVKEINDKYTEGNRFINIYKENF